MYNKNNQKKYLIIFELYSKISITGGAEPYEKNPFCGIGSGTFIKTGGLADVVGSLPKAFNKEEFDVRVVLPKYRVIPEYFHQQMEYMTNFYINLAGRMIYVGVFQMVLDGVTFYFY